MSTIVLQFGQCGNQVGDALFSYLYEDANSACNPEEAYGKASKQLWFDRDRRGTYYARALAIDTENKVVSGFRDKSRPFLYRNLVTSAEGGSANNWAFGYRGTSTAMVQNIVERLRLEFEANDSISSLLSIMGSAGGTGSGLGTRVLESLKAEFPSKTLLNAVILPYEAGEVAVQSYNTVLTLAKLQEAADASLVFENDLVHRACKSLLGVRDVEFHHLNSLIAKKVAAALQPAAGCSNIADALVLQLAAHPAFKLVQLRSAPFRPQTSASYEPTTSWELLCAQLKQSFKHHQVVTTRDVTTQPKSRPRVVSQSARCVGNLLVTRGGQPPQKKALDQLAEPGLYPKWVAEADRLQHLHQPRKLCDADKFATLATNNSAIVGVLDPIVEQAWQLFAYKAYVHQYCKFGVGESDLMEAFEKMETVLHAYKNL